MLARKTIPGEEVRATFRNAPDFVQEVFNSEETMNTIQALRTQYQISPELAPVLGREVGYAILGLRTPSEFMQALTESGIGWASAGGLVEEVNKKILSSLQSKVSAMQESIPTADAATSREEITLSEPRTPSSNTPIEVVQPVLKAPALPVPPPPTPTPVVSPSTVVAKPIMPPVPVAPIPMPVAPPLPRPEVHAPPVAQFRTMAMDVANVGAPHKTHSQPVPATPRSVAPKPPTPAPTPYTNPPQIPPVNGFPRAETVKEDLKKFGIDPYREPIE